MQSQYQQIAGLVLGIWVGFEAVAHQSAQAQAIETQASDNGADVLLEQLQALDEAASQEDMANVLKYYSTDFWHGDGLNRSNLSLALQEFWDRYSNLTYTTELLSWEETEAGIVTETQTQIQGTETLDNRELALNVTLHNRSQWQNNQILTQEVIAEHSQIQTGEQPPTVEFLLPEQVEVNSQFSLDVIVEEPLEDDLVLGAVLNEPVRQHRFFDLTELDVQPLSAGGIFKTARAPAVRDDRWVSAVIIRKGGITLVTQRLRIVE